MAIKDKKEWQKLFYNRLNYQPASKLRKLSQYNRKIEFYEALEIAGETGNNFLIQIIFPFDTEQKESIAVFPQAIAYDKDHLYELAEPILYAGKFYTLDKFIAECPPLILDNLIGMFNSYVFSLSYFVDDTKQAEKFRKHLTPIRSKITQTHWWAESRGPKGGSSTIAERNKIILQKYKELKGKFKNLEHVAWAIKENLTVLATEKFKNRELVPTQMKQYKTYCCEESTILRVLRKDKEFMK